MDDLGRELDALTSAATRGVVPPTPEVVRRRAGQSRRQVFGAGLAAFAVGAIAVAAVLSGGGAPAPTTPDAAPTSSPKPAVTGTTRSAPPPSPTTKATETASATEPAVAVVQASALLAAADVGSGWTLDSGAVRPGEVQFDPCGDGRLGPKPGSQQLRKFTSDAGEVLEHVMGYSEPDAKAAMQAVRSAVKRCGLNPVSYDDRGGLAGSGDLMVLKVVGGPQDPITTYVTVRRVGGLVMTLQDTRMGRSYTEKEHRALATKAAARL